MRFESVIGVIFASENDFDTQKLIWSRFLDLNRRSIFYRLAFIGIL